MAVIRPSWLGCLSSGQFGQVSDDYSSSPDWKSFDDGTWRNIDLSLWYKACMGRYLWVVLSRITCAMSWGGLPVVSQFVHRAVILTFVQKYLYLIVVVIKTLWHYLLCLSQERYLRLKNDIIGLLQMLLKCVIKLPDITAKQINALLMYTKFICDNSTFKKAETVYFVEW